MPTESRPDQRSDDRPVGSSGPPHPAETGRDVARNIDEPGSVDMHRPIAEGQPGHGAAPGGEPVASSGDPGGEPVPPPGTADGGSPGGPPAAHEQPPK